MMDCSETALSKKTLLPASLALLLFIYVTLRCLAQMSVTQVPRLTRVNNLFSMFVLKMLEKQALRQGQRKRWRALRCLKDETKPLCMGLDEGW